ncbi:hypothetical protein fugu_007199 [Takifugu bimaculatus]|uniref:Uncharacterized protein n=1 Tax=Takifugu bimaculatus TaxID=433685 RepID=A0A4Z2B579_9TELE|nr:hypothetical protein fugu_007199 [Takifugu bimaculatus]
MLMNGQARGWKDSKHGSGGGAILQPSNTRRNQPGWSCYQGRGHGGTKVRKVKKKMFLRTTQTDEEQEKRQSRSGKGGEGAGGCGERKHVVLLKILQCGGEIWGLRGG